MGLRFVCSIKWAYIGRRMIMPEEIYSEQGLYHSIFVYTFRGLHPFFLLISKIHKTSFKGTTFYSVTGCLKQLVTGYVVVCPLSYTVSKSFFLWLCMAFFQVLSWYHSANHFHGTVTLC